jgi:formate dehydrogenase subunit gamma
MTARTPPQPWSDARAAEIAAAHADTPGGLLPLLQEFQATFGFIADSAVPLIAQALNLSRAEVHGVLTFYHDFRRAPPGRHILKVCLAEACRARGAESTLQVLEQALQAHIGETSPNGQATLEPAYCLGLCASGPALLLDDHPVARLVGTRLEKLIVEVGR